MYSRTWASTYWDSAPHIPGLSLSHVTTERSKDPDVLPQKMGIFLPKRSGCFRVKHPGVFMKKVRML